MDPIDEELLDAVLKESIERLRAEKAGTEPAESDTSLFDTLSMADYEAHVSGRRPFTEQELEEIRSDPRRKRMLERFEHALRLPFIERLMQAIRNLTAAPEPNLRFCTI